MKDKDNKNSDERQLTLQEKWKHDSLAYEEFFKDRKDKDVIPIHYPENKPQGDDML